MALAGGVTAPAGVVVEVGSLGALAGSAGCTVVSVIAGRAAIKSEGFLQTSKDSMDNLPIYNASNFSDHLKNLVGNPPSGMVNPQAHHVLPQKFKDYFNAKGINIHDPKYGIWVAREEHQGWSYYYNQDWDAYIHSPKWASALISDIENFARILSQKYGGYSVNF